LHRNQNLDTKNNKKLFMQLIFVGEIWRIDGAALLEVNLIKSPMKQTLNKICDKLIVTK